MKQEALAVELGISQQTISKLEQSEEIEDSTLDKVTKVLGVSVDAIKSFTEKSIFNYFNNFSDNSVNQGPIGSHNICNFNPIDKLMEALDANKDLYERLLASEKQNVEILKSK